MTEDEQRDMALAILTLVKVLQDEYPSDFTVMSIIDNMATTAYERRACARVFGDMTIEQFIDTMSKAEMKGLDNATQQQ